MVCVEGQHVKVPQEFNGIVCNAVQCTLACTFLPAPHRPLCLGARLTTVCQEKFPNQEVQGEIPLEGCSVEFVAEDKYGEKFCFELHTMVNKVR